MTRTPSRPVVAIVGRPNVGKSTLFNRLVGKRIAIVHDRPGVTRDRREADATLHGVRFRAVDTAGLEQAQDDSLEGRMRQQTARALDGAAAVLFVIDGRDGLIAADRDFAGMLRRTALPVIVVVNKCEGSAGDATVLDAFGLGFGQPISISAEHGLGMGDLSDALAPHLAAPGPEAHAVPSMQEIDDEDADGPGPLQLAIVGRPNVGKSTLANRLLGEERMLTGPEPGVTRDAIPIDWVWNDHDIRLVDTAGLRRKARVSESLEKLSAADTLRAVRLASVVVLVVDATMPLERQELNLARHVVEEGRVLVIALNKWDAVRDKKATLKKVDDKLTASLTQVRGVPLVRFSALSGSGVQRLMPAVLKAYEVWQTRVSTARLNRWLESMVEAHPPPIVRGRRLRLRYMTQIKGRPPTFVLFASRAEQLPAHYRRYLVNGLRDTFGLDGVPIRLSVRRGDNPYAPQKG